MCNRAVDCIEPAWTVPSERAGLGVESRMLRSTVAEFADLMQVTPSTATGSACSLSRTKTDLARSAGSEQGLRLVTVLRNPRVPSSNGARAVAVHADEIDESAAVGSDLAPDAQDPSILENPVGIGLQPLLAVVLSMPPFSSGCASCSTCASHGSTPLPIRRWKPPGDAAGVRAAARDAARRRPPRCGVNSTNSSVRVTSSTTARPEAVVEVLVDLPAVAQRQEDAAQAAAVCGEHFSRRCRRPRALGRRG